MSQKEKLVGENERKSKWRHANNTQSIKRFGPVTEAADAQSGISLPSTLSNFGQICYFGDQAPSQGHMNLTPASKYHQMTPLHTIEDSCVVEDGTEMILLSEDQDALITSGQTNVQGAAKDELTCTLVHFSNIYEVDQTPDTAQFEVIPSLFFSQTPQLTLVPETVLSSALSPQPITSIVPIVSKYVQSSKADKGDDTEEEEKDDVKLDSSSLEHQQQVEHWSVLLFNIM